jgi:hypothetical protein
MLSLYKKICKTVFIVWLLLQMLPGYARQSYDRLWSSNIVIGSVVENSNFKYYFQTDLRFINSPYVFNQWFLLGGFGYQFQPGLILFAGYGWILDKSFTGDVNHERRLWQQLNWSKDMPSFNINSRTRAEEIINTVDSGIAYRIRERLWFRIPFKKDSPYFLSIFDEIFLNLNHPRWVSPYLFSQNRAFLGIGRNFSKSVMLDVGYLNQFVHARENQLNNVIFLNLTVTL